MAAVRPEVRTGEKAIKIIGHSTKEITTRDPETGEDIEDRIPRWPTLSVFDISQTEGDDVPSGRYELPDGDGLDGALPRLIAWLACEGWGLREEPLPEQVEGYTDHTQRLISTATGLEPAARLAVLLHEAAHAVLHVDVDAFEYQAHRGSCETDAESVAYVLAGLLGVRPRCLVHLLHRRLVACGPGSPEPDRIERAASRQWHRHRIGSRRRRRTAR